jgi:phage shock protein PspC (stress-responsive transcriptional regulator)
MNKTIIINISGSIFHIEEDAYEKLKVYMTEVKSHFQKTEDSFEIISDIENRIAELFTEIIQAEEKQVIVMNDVDRIIRTMGQAKDFENVLTEEEEIVAENYQIKKRLYRNPDDKIVGGVCSGIAAYFDVDPLWVRLGLAVSILFFGTGLFLYLILWIIMPEAISRTEKLAMRGEAPTIESIRKSIEEEMGNVKRNFKNAAGEFRNSGNQSALRQLITTLLEVAQKAVKIFMLVLTKAIGTIIMIASGAMAVAFSIAIMAVLGLIDKQIDADIPLFMLRDDHQNLMYFAWYMIIIIPIISIFLIGLRIVFNTNPFNKISGWSMFSIWILSVFVGGYYAIDTLGNFREEGRLQETKTITPSSINKFYLVSDYDEKYNYYDSVKTQQYGLKDKMILKSNRHNFGFDNVDLRIEKSIDNEMKLVTTYLGRGRTESFAIESAENIQYLFSQNDSVLTFARFFKLKDNSSWRNQKIEMTLYVPYNTELVVQERVDRILHNVYSGECIRDEYDRIHWSMGKDGMECKKDTTQY